MKRSLIPCVAAILALSSSSTTATPASSPSFSRIKMLDSGWYEPNLRIYVDGTVYNPENCPDATSYIIPSNLPANQQLTAMALTAYSLKHQVSFVLDGCT
ncbi:hypothetical protein [Asticcacaulis sp. 201]|uniref:hypothetical protein n=1 Tax=Asticcacaulis sp. 201 TaxID=3028787 RepID=UPI002916B05D|nr:hypothetical protein [Asticcacaulis sp. 201]MDV6331297.1 hypothetical protein [Asticcacaulis sp. 201]